MNKKDQNIPQPVLFDAEEMGRITPGDIWEEKNKPVTCLGMEFPNDDARREYFRDELRKKRSPEKACGCTILNSVIFRFF